MDGLGKLYRWMATAATLALFCSLAVASEPILRSGIIAEVTTKGLYTYLKVSDGEGKTFYVVAEICSAAPDEKLQVINGDHYDAMEIPPLGGKVEDVYLAYTMTIGGREVIAASGEGKIPQGCQILR